MCEPRTVPVTRGLSTANSAHSGQLEVVSVEEAAHAAGNDDGGAQSTFVSVDWWRDMARDRRRHNNGILDGAHGWLCLLIVGLVAGACGASIGAHACAGTIAGAIDIGTEWFSDLRNGVCVNAWWLNRVQCCWAESDHWHPEMDCQQVGDG